MGQAMHIECFHVTSHAAMLMVQNNRTAAMLENPTNPPAMGHFRVAVCLGFEVSLGA